MKVLSLFDGMGCLGIVLKDMGYEFEYYSSEIDKNACKVSKLNFPDSVQLGDVTKWREWDIDWSKIDLIGAGSPCQGFSFAGKQLAFDDPRSALFFVFVEILRHCQQFNPDVKFLLENVKMKKEHELVISRYMGVAPIEIDAALVSAQSRRRLFWTNIYNEPYGLFGDMQCMIPQPKDRGILLKDILESDVPEKYYLSDRILNGFANRKSQWAGIFKPTYGNKKANCVTSRCYKMGVDDNYIKVPEATKQGYAEVKPGECFDLTMPTSETRRGRLMEDKSNCLTASKFDFMQYTKDYRIRRLTPTECARLQSIPDWYQWGDTSDTQIYRMLGNGWCVEVIKHILSYL